jgi:AcrR family transcriptional regulator
MATKKQNPENIAKADVKFTKDQLISLYMGYVLEHEKMPKSVFKFCKENSLTEEQFYNFFGSFDGLRQGVWNQFFDNTLDLIEKSPEFEDFTTREKLLTFYYTFFELLTANRSYVLFTLTDDPEMFKNMDQLKGLRRRMKGFANQLIREGNEDRSVKLLKQSETIFSEAAWLQLLFILKFWMDDNSAKFESTDIVIEKSVNTVFDLFDTTPLESLLDFGKFMWKEKMG